MAGQERGSVSDVMASSFGTLTTEISRVMDFNITGLNQTSQESTSSDITTLGATKYDISDMLSNQSLNGTLDTITGGITVDTSVFSSVSPFKSSVDYFYDSSTFNTTFNSTTPPPALGYGVAESIAVWIVVGFLIILTAGGNLMVILSFKMDKQLQTVSNYFLLSLAVADFCIGIVSMPLYTLYMLLGYWPLGPIVCDIWLSWDYVMSNASVANLIIISLDRYLSVTRPLTYRAKRTPKRAAIMISCAWLISMCMWTPWIFAWPHIEGKRTVKKGECYIQFLASNEYITIATAMAAFYIPVLILCILYYKIFKETKKRNKGLEKLQAGRQLKYKAAMSENSDDEAHVTTNLSIRHNDSSPDIEGMDENPPVGLEDRPVPQNCWQKFKHCCRIDRDPEYMDDSTGSDTPASPLYDLTPSSSTKQSTLRHDVSLPGHYQQNGRGLAGKRNNSNPLMVPLIAVSNRASPCTPSTDVTSVFSRSTTMSSPPIDLRRKPAILQEMKGSRSHDSDKSDSDTYTIVIKLPEEGCDDLNSKPSIRMLSESDEDAALLPPGPSDSDSNIIAKHLESMDDPTGGVVEALEMQKCDFTQDATPPGGRRDTGSGDHIRSHLNRGTQKYVSRIRNQRARKRKQEKRQDRKAAKTLSAILLAFVITWTPYNIFTLITPFCQKCIGSTLYAIGKYKF